MHLPNPSIWAGCDTRSICKWSLTGLNLEFSFFLTSCHTKVLVLVLLFNAKSILQEEQQWNYLTHSWKDKGIYAFPKDICLKVKKIALLEFELAYYDSAVQPLHLKDTLFVKPRFESLVCPTIYLLLQRD